MTEQCKQAIARRDEYARQLDAMTRERDQWRLTADNALAQVEKLTAERDEYRDQADNYAAVVTEHEKRIAELEKQLALGDAITDRLTTDLAKMPHTPDGTLVVLGETTLWTRHRGETAKCWPWQITRHAGVMFVLGQWMDGCTSFTQEVMLSDCYGSEAALTKAEGRDA